MKTCPICGGDVPTSREGARKYCSPECASVANNDREEKKRAKERVAYHRKIADARISRIVEEWPWDRIPNDVTWSQMAPLG